MSNHLSATEIASRMDHVSSATDANNVTNALLDSMHGMSLNESLAFARQVRSAQLNDPDHRQGRGEDMAITTDMTHAHMILFSPYTATQRIELTDDNKPVANDRLSAQRPGDKPELTPAKVAADMDHVHSAADANAVWQELQTAVTGMNVPDTVDFLRRTAALDHKTGADLALVVGDQGQPQLEFTSPYTAPLRGDLTDDSKPSK